MFEPPKRIGIDNFFEVRGGKVDRYYPLPQKGIKLGG